VENQGTVFFNKKAEEIAGSLWNKVEGDNPLF